MRAVILFSVLIAGVFAQLQSDNTFQLDDDWLQSSDSNKQQQGTPAALSPEILNILTRQQQLQRQQLESESNTPSSASSLGFWATYPEAAPFDAKIRGRLESSTVLNNKPAVRQKLMEIADEKFNQCKGKVDNMERACLGRATGQVMQLVSAVENMSRNQQ